MDDDEEEEPSSADDRGRSKRQRTGSANGGREMVSMDAMTATLSSVIASAIASSGSAVTSAVSSKTNEAKEEQRRREHAEQRIREMEKERVHIEAEVARLGAKVGWVILSSCLVIMMKNPSQDAKHEAAVESLQKEFKERMKTELDSLRTSKVCACLWL